MNTGSFNHTIRDSDDDTVDALGAVVIPIIDQSNTRSTNVEERSAYTYRSLHAIMQHDVLGDRFRSGISSTHIKSLYKRVNKKVDFLKIKKYRVLKDVGKGMISIDCPRLANQLPYIQFNCLRNGTRI